MELKDKFKNGISGQLCITAVNRSGDILFRHEWNNLITTDGYDAAAECLAGEAGAVITSVSCGTNADTPTVDDTAITDAVNVPITHVTYPENGSVMFHFLVDWEDADGMDIYEWGLITQDGRLFSRLTRAIISKTEEMQLLGQWEIRLKEKNS